MILLSPDAAEDVERLRAFLDRENPNAAKRALAAIWIALERVQEFPGLGGPTEDPIAQLTGMQLAGVPGANGALNCSFVVLRAP